MCVGVRSRHVVCAHGIHRAVGSDRTISSIVASMVFASYEKEESQDVDLH